MAPDSQTRKALLLLLGSTLLLTTVSAAEITASMEDSFKGYQGHALGAGDSSPIVVGFEGFNQSEAENLNAKDNFSVELSSELSNVEKEWRTESRSLILKPEVITDNTEIGSQKFDINLTYINNTGDKPEFEYSDLTEDGERPEINVSEPWNLEIVSKGYDGRVIDAQNLASDFSYEIQAYYLGEKSEETNDLYTEEWQNNFEVTIKKYSENSDDFELYPEDSSYEDKKWISIEKLKPDQTNGLYRLYLSETPPEELDTGSYKFTVNMVGKQPDSYHVVDTYVNKYMTFSGQVRDVVLGTGIKSDIILNDETQKTILTTKNGDYSEDLVPKTWSSANLQFYPEGQKRSKKLWDTEVIVDNPSIKDSSGAIKYHYVDWSGGTPDLGVKGVTPANLMAVEFSYPIDGARISMEYDSGEVSSENMVVMECNSWNFDKASRSLKDGCQGEWQRISGSKVSVTYSEERKANFPVEELHQASKAEGGSKDILMNAYIVGTSADLVLNGRLSVSGTESGRVATGSQITVEGNINSENEKPVEGADVEVGFYQGDREISSLETVQTDITGRFVATGEAPEEPGNYSVRITADKENYNELEQEFDNRFETFVKEGIAVRTGSNLKVSPGEEKNSEITVQNTGQTDMNDVSLSFEGMDSQYYSISKASFEQIPAGEEKTTELTVSLPSDYCDGGCGDWPSLDVSATATNSDGEEFEAKEETLQVQISRTNSGQSTDESSSSSETEQVSSQTDDSNNSGSAFTQSVSELENATGEFIASQSSLNLALGMIMVFMMVLAGAVKKQDDGRSRDSRGDRGGRSGGRPRVQKPNVGGGSSVKQVEPEQEEDEVDSVVEQIDRAESGNEDVDSQIDAIAGSVAGEQQEDTKVVEIDDKHQQTSADGQELDGYETKEVEGEQKFVCQETGKEFDTKAALKLHRQINGLESN